MLFAEGVKNGALQSLGASCCCVCVCVCVCMCAKRPQGRAPGTLQRAAEGCSAAQQPGQGLREGTRLTRQVTLSCGAPGARIKVVENEAGRQEHAAALGDWEPAPSSRDPPAVHGREARHGGAHDIAGNAPGGAEGSQFPQITREALAGRCAGAHAAAAHPGQGSAAPPEGQAGSGAPAVAPPHTGTAPAAGDGGAAGVGDPVQRAIAFVSSAVDALEAEACPALNFYCVLPTCMVMERQRCRA